MFISHFQTNSQNIPPPAIIVPITTALAMTRPKTSLPPLTKDTAAPVNTGVALFVGVGVTFTLAAEDDDKIEFPAVALPLEVACEVEVAIVALQGKVTVTVMIDPLLSEDAEAELEVDVKTCEDDEEVVVVETTAVDDRVGVPSPPVTDGKGGAELPTAEQMAFPAVLLDSMQIAPNCG